jgi:hypothetical protein
MPGDDVTLRPTISVEIANTIGPFDTETEDELPIASNAAADRGLAKPAHAGEDTRKPPFTIGQG